MDPGAVPHQSRLSCLPRRAIIDSVIHFPPRCRCALLSFGYLWAIHILLWNQAREQSEVVKHFAENLYHICFAYLRPLYALAFALYYLRRFRSNRALELVQVIVCGFGVIFFTLLCPIAVTGFTKSRPTCSHPLVHRVHNESNSYIMDGELHNLETPLSKSAHRMESTAFYFNMVLFVIHGLCSGSWDDTSQPALSFLNVAAISNLAAFVCIGVLLPILAFLRLSTGSEAYDEMKWFPAEKKAANYLVWVTLHYWCGYCCAIFQSAYILGWRLRKLVIFHPIVPMPPTPPTSNGIRIGDVPSKFYYIDSGCSHSTCE